MWWSVRLEEDPIKQSREDHGGLGALEGISGSNGSAEDLMIVLIKL